MTIAGNDSQADPMGSQGRNPDFQEGTAYELASADGLAVSLDGYEGPLDVLLDLARTQKLDLKQISILHLAEQYLDFIRRARDLKIELAADYLVMASWLAYLKSRLLLPPPHEPDEADPEELAAQLVFRLQCLEAMRDAAAKLMARNLLGRDFFAHGMPEGIGIKRESVYQSSLFELLAAYASQRVRDHYSAWTPPNINVLSIERARLRLQALLGALDDWQPLNDIVAGSIREPQKRRTTIASSFTAMLEYASDGRLEVQQSANFGEVLVRRVRPKVADA